MRLVDDEGKTLARELTDLGGYHGELLEGGDNDGLAVFQRRP